MTREQAAKEARKRWGKTAYIRAHETLSSPDKRAQSDRLFRAAKERMEAIEREINERLNALDWYQALSAERKEMLKQKQAHQWERCYHKFAVGEVPYGIGFHIEGEGDTWEEAFAEADAKKAKAS